MAEFEKELLIERILAGQARARSEGAVFGRKPTFGTAEQRAVVLQRLADGISVSAVARAFGTSRQAVLPGPLAFLPVASLMFQQRLVYHADVVVIGKQVAMQHQPGAASAGDRLRPKGWTSAPLARGERLQKAGNDRLFA